MIKFCDVGKTYISKSKNRVEALKNVNFQLGESGMVFILGKSGSGKSTLLNLLGGLDKPTVGNIEVDGVSMNAFKQSDFESYRNSYVGFVFQEYNLLDDFNVKDNIALALQLTKDANIEQKVIDALKQVELGEQYLTRRVGELSGGEKQRVAIARAIVKDSKIILADEPTGNLDSETGESIWTILKTLSETRPVIVVSHDRESAEKYSDRTIEIADGKVIADNGVVKEEDKTVQQNKFVPVKNRLSFAMCLKMGFNSLVKHKARTVSLVLVSVFTLCAMLISQLVLTFIPERAFIKHINKHNPEFITVTQGYETEEAFHRVEDTPNLSTLQYLKENSQTQEWGYAENKQQLLDFGFEFIGDAQELDLQSFYISENALNSIYEASEQYPMYTSDAVLIDGKEELIFSDTFPAEKLIGKKVRLSLSGLQSNKFFTLAGVIKSVNITLPSFFAMEQFEGRTNEFLMPAILNIDGVNKKLHQLSQRIPTYYKMITEDGEIDPSTQQIVLAENEIVIDWSTVTEFTGLNEVTTESIHNILGKSFAIKYIDSSGQTRIDLGQCKIKGVIKSTDRDDSIYLNEIVLRKLVRAYNRKIIVRTDSVKNISQFVLTLRYDHGGFIQDVGSVQDEKGNDMSIVDSIVNFDAIKEFAVILLIICIVLVAVIILLTINLISFSITNRRKEIGILSAIGASSWDITKIFILETLILSVIIAVIALSLTFASIAIINTVYSHGALKLVQNLTFCTFDPYAILTLLGVCFVLLPLFALIPTIRIAKLKPIDAIRVL